MAALAALVPVLPPVLLEPLPLLPPELPPPEELLLVLPLAVRLKLARFCALGVMPRASRPEKSPYSAASSARVYCRSKSAGLLLVSMPMSCKKE